MLGFGGEQGVMVGSGRGDWCFMEHLLMKIKQNIYIIILSFFFSFHFFFFFFLYSYYVHTCAFYRKAGIL